MKKERASLTVLGRMLTSYRKNTGTLQKDLARKIGIKPYVLCRVEKGNAPMDLETFAKFLTWMSQKEKA